MAPADPAEFDGYGDLDEATRYRKVQEPEFDGKSRSHRHDFRGRGPSKGQRSDACIREEIEYFLTEHDEIDATELEVRVFAGEVLLKGVVPEAHMGVLALEVTLACRGVRSVRNEVCVASKEPPEPQGSYELSAKSSGEDSENEDKPPSVARTALK